MVDLKTVETAAKADVSKLTTELGFVRANWAKLSAIIVLSGIVGALIGKFLL